MPRPACAATASSRTAVPDCPNTPGAAGGRLSRLRWASARRGFVRVLMSRKRRQPPLVCYVGRSERRTSPLLRLASRHLGDPMDTLISTPFGFHTTAAEVLDGINLSGKRAVVTGAASGIGIETARALAGAGAAVTLAVRDTARGSEVATDISTATGNEQVEVGAL